MTVRPCDINVTGCPCINDDPFANFSSEAPDPFSTLRMSWVAADPPINSPDNYYTNLNGLGACTDADPQTAQDCADGDAYRQGHIEQPVFSSHATSCSVPCPSGGLFSYSLPAGAIVAATQELADYLAGSICFYRAELAKRCAPTVVTGIATDIDDVSAVLNGTVNPNGASTTYFFQWGLTTAYGNLTPVTSVGSGRITLAVAAILTGLTGGTTYHYRIIGISSQGTSAGADETFDTVVSVTPLAWWKMEENGAGNRIDVIGGITLSPTVILGAVARTTGKIDFGVKLSGVGAPPFPIDTILANFVDQFPYVADDGLDITFWFNGVTFANGLVTLIGVFNPIAFANVQVSSSSGMLTLDLGFSGSVSTPWTFGAGWKLIRFFIDPDAGEFGLQVNTAAPITIPFPSPNIDGFTGNYQLGITSDNNLLASQLDIRWDELAIWPRKLTTDEYNNIWNGGAGRTWPF